MKLISGNKTYDVMIIEGVQYEKRQASDGIPAVDRIPEATTAGYTGGQDNIGNDTQVH